MSEHWYDRDGNPRYTVQAANGFARPTTLRDARKLNLVPSVTTVLNIAAKPGLMQWMQRQVLLAALTLPRVHDETEDAYIARILEDSKAQARAAADAGTDIHAAIQGFYEGEQVSRHREHVEATTRTITDAFGYHGWIAERSFSHELGFGGKVDLHSPEGVVIDIKTKEFTDKVDAYDEHLMQLCAYRVGLGIPDARCANVFVSRSVPGLCKLIEWSKEDLDRGWKMFVNLLTFWQLKHGHQ
jgi:hypothetical protein